MKTVLDRIQERLEPLCVKVSKPIRGGYRTFSMLLQTGLTDPDPNEDEKRARGERVIKQRTKPLSPELIEALKQITAELNCSSEITDMGSGWWSAEFTDEELPAEIKRSPFASVPESMGALAGAALRCAEAMQRCATEAAWKHSQIAKLRAQGLSLHQAEAFFDGAALASKATTQHMHAVVEAAIEARKLPGR